MRFSFRKNLLETSLWLPVWGLIGGGAVVTLLAAGGPSSAEVQTVNASLTKQEPLDAPGGASPAVNLNELPVIDESANGEPIGDHAAEGAPVAADGPVEPAVGGISAENPPPRATQISALPAESGSPPLGAGASKNPGHPAAHQAPAAGSPQPQPASSPNPSVERESHDTHRLVSVRVRPYPQFIRVVLLFDGPTPYALRRDELNNRLFVDLIGASVPYFPSELNRIADVRLAGIRLETPGPELATLEMRLLGDASIEDFALSDPAAVVLDIRHAGDDRAALPGAPEMVVKIETTHPGRPAMPPAFALAADHPAASDDPTSQSVAQHGEDESAATLHEAATLPADSASTISEVEGPAAEHDDIDLTPTLAAVYGPPAFDEFEGFPVEDIKPRDPPVRQILEQFRNQRWAEVLTEGVRALERDPDLRDLEPLLYLMAEARYRLDRQTASKPSTSAVNFYEQALRRNEAGSLGAFANWRLGAMMRDLQRYEEARFYFEEAQQRIDPARSGEVKLDLARILARVGETDEAIAMVQQIRASEMAAATLLEAAMLEANLLEESGDAARAFEVLKIADRIEPEWWKRSIERADLYSRIVDAQGDLDAAYDVLFFAAYYFADQADRHPGVFLRYADLVRRLRDRALDNGRPREATEYDEEARLWYARILRMVDAAESDNAAVREAKARLAGLDGSVYGRGLASYALYLMGRGETLEAMEQLEKAHAHTRMNAGRIQDLQEPAGLILEPFMDWAVARKRWDEVIGAWSVFGELLPEGPARNAALGKLALATLRLGSPEGALGLIELLKQKTDEAGTPPADLLEAWEAEVLVGMGRIEEALPRLEQLAATPSLTSTRLDALRVLARAYREMDRPLQTAQTLEEIARTVELRAEERGEAWSQAAAIYLREGMEKQATEIALRGLIFEEDHAKGSDETIWSDTTAQELRLVLAESYVEARDYPRAMVALEDALALEGLNKDARAQALMLMARMRRELGEDERAAEAFRSVRDAKAIDPVWKAASTAELGEMEWNPEAEYEARIRSRLK